MNKTYAGAEITVTANPAWLNSAAFNSMTHYRTLFKHVTPNGVWIEKNMEICY
jgi:hypothetical protein